MRVAMGPSEVPPPPPQTVGPKDKAVAFMPPGVPSRLDPQPPGPWASPASPLHLPKASFHQVRPLSRSTAHPGARTPSGHREAGAPWAQRSPCQPGAGPRRAAAAAAAAGPFQAGGSGWGPRPSAPRVLLSGREGQQEAGTERPGQVGGQGRLEMINPGCLQCWAHMVLVSASPLTPPGPAVPSGISSGLDNVLSSQLRSHFQEVFQDSQPVGTWTLGPSFQSPRLRRDGHGLFVSY